MSNIRGVNDIRNNDRGGGGGGYGNAFRNMNFVTNDGTN